MIDGSPGSLSRSVAASLKFERSAEVRTRNVCGAGRSEEIPPRFNFARPRHVPTINAALPPLLIGDAYGILDLNNMSNNSCDSVRNSMTMFSACFSHPIDHEQRTRAGRTQGTQTHYMRWPWPCHYKTYIHENPSLLRCLILDPRCAQSPR